MSAISAVRLQLMCLGLFAVPKEIFPKSLQSFHSLINRMYAIFVVIISLPYPTSVIYFLSFEATTLAEYAESSLFCAATFLLVAFYLVVLFNRLEFMQLMKDFEETVQESE